MSGVTSIEWTDRTWNPVTGCTKVSPGCDRCYADAIAHRFAGTTSFPNGFAVTLHPERLDAPLRWRRPSRVFVNSMSDLFHAEIPDEFVAKVFAVMAAASAHTFQVLTKRPGRMRSLLQSDAFREEVQTQVVRHRGAATIPVRWPLHNVWLGVSAEDQRWADVRIPVLLTTPAAVRFVSAEPLLGSLHLHEAWAAGLDWVIVGGESGPGARRMDLGWAAGLVGQCHELGVAPFVKQLGSAYGPGKGGDTTRWPAGLRVRKFPTVTAGAQS